VPIVEEQSCAAPQVPTVNKQTVVVPQVLNVRKPLTRQDSIFTNQKKTVDQLPDKYVDASLPYSEMCDCGKVDVDNICTHCIALLFKSDVSDNSLQLCCHEDKSCLPHSDIPQSLKDLMESNNQECKDYLLYLYYYFCS